MNAGTNVSARAQPGDRGLTGIVYDLFDLTELPPAVTASIQFSSVHTEQALSIAFDGAISTPSTERDFASILRAELERAGHLASGSSLPQRLLWGSIRNAHVFNG